MIRVQTDDFDISKETAALRIHGDIGAIVTFTGIVREFLEFPSETAAPAKTVYKASTGNKPKANSKEKSDNTNSRFFLEHYPGMTEKVIAAIEAEAQSRWNIYASTVIHRVGHLNKNDNIVFVGIGSRHRREAFLACEFIIDVLKTKAPFWKKEGSNWVKAKEEDTDKTDHWFQSPTEK